MDFETSLSFLKDVISAFGGLAAIAVASAGAAYWLFQLLAERWLQAKFDARLEDLKHAQNKEIERLRFQINALLDRASRMHGHEYKALPEIWSSLVMAWREVAFYLSPLQPGPDLFNITPAQLEEFLASTPLSETQKTHVRDSDDRMAAYREVIYYHKKSRILEVVRTFSLSLSTHAIFLPQELMKPLRRLDDLIWEALNEHADNEELKFTPRERKAYKELTSEGKPLMEQIERRFHERMLSEPMISS